MCQFFTLNVNNVNICINLNNIAVLESSRSIFSSTYTLKLTDGSSYELRKSEGRRLEAVLRSHTQE